MGGIGAIIGIVSFAIGIPAGWPDGVKYTLLGIGIAAMAFWIWQRFLQPTQSGASPGDSGNTGGMQTWDVSNGSIGNISGGVKLERGTLAGNYTDASITDKSTTYSGSGAGSTVQGSQYNAGQDQFINNCDVNTGGGDINDYGGVQGGVHNYSGVHGNVNSGAGSQTNINAGNISGNVGNIALGSGISQSYAAGSQANQIAATLLSALEDLRDQIDSKLEGNDSQRLSVRTPLTTAIKSLRGGQIDSSTVSSALQQAADALTKLNMSRERNILKSAAWAAGLNIA